MEALTPARLSPPSRSPCFTYPAVLTIPPPTTPAAPVAAFTRYPSARQVSPSLGSRLRHSLAGSPDGTGRIGFVILRTGRSPPVAPHPASRRRSYSRLQAGERMPEGDFHPSDGVRLQAHECGSLLPLSCAPAGRGANRGGSNGHTGWVKASGRRKFRVRKKKRRQAAALQTGYFPAPVIQLCLAGDVGSPTAHGARSFGGGPAAMSFFLEFHGILS